MTGHCKPASLRPYYGSGG